MSPWISFSVKFSGVKTLWLEGGIGIKPALTSGQMKVQVCGSLNSTCVVWTSHLGGSSQSPPVSLKGEQAKNYEWLAASCQCHSKQDFSRLLWLCGGQQVSNPAPPQKPSVKMVHCSRGSFSFHEIKWLQSHSFALFFRWTDCLWTNEKGSRSKQKTPSRAGSCQDTI